MKTFAIQVLFLCFFTAIIELASYFLVKTPYSLFYYHGAESEYTSNLYSKLDPLLGYTFDRSTTPTSLEKKSFITTHQNWKQRGSYIVFSHLENSSPLKILILGGSATDSNLFHGNWPYYLHLLMKEKSVPHIIFNGAVSGYSSYQEYLKLYRDQTNFNSIDLVIVYDGINDFVGNEDVVENHPWIHPYEKRNYQILSGGLTRFTRATLLPNLRAFIMQTLQNSSTEVDFGFSTELYPNLYMRNISLMGDLAKKSNSQFIHILQPILTLAKQKSRDFFDSRGANYVKEAQKFYVQINQPQTDSSLNISKDLVNSEAIFLDYVHLNQNGNKRVAQIIYKKIREPSN